MRLSRTLPLPQRQLLGDQSPG
uniref:(California timema) hypothetical protein n=1 Tax=Timema californicum TaxID=61474 RepID=A0A7R9JKX6_TIMCA|nr:unnamed protein product [Timema californicum]